MIKQSEKVQKIFKAKKARRKELASLPIEEKFKILIELQKITSPIFRSRGLERKPWAMQIFQVNEATIMAESDIKSINAISNKAEFLYPSNINFITNDGDSNPLEWEGF